MLLFDPCCRVIQSYYYSIATIDACTIQRRWRVNKNLYKKVLLTTDMGGWFNKTFTKKVNKNLYKKVLLTTDMGGWFDLPDLPQLHHNCGVAAGGRGGRRRSSKVDR
jgi:hypothetical protein